MFVRNLEDHVPWVPACLLYKDLLPKLAVELIHAVLFAGLPMFPETASCSPARQGFMMHGSVV